MKKLLFISGMVLCLFSCTPAFAKVEPAVAAIDKLVRETEDVERRATTKEIVLATVLDKEEIPGDWKVCDPKSDVNYNDEAHLYFAGKRLISFSIRLGTPTEDWGESRYYCYRKDGSLAYIRLLSWSWNEPPFRTEAMVYINSTGQVIKELVKYYDPENKPVKLNKSDYKTPESYLTTQAALNKFARDLKGITPPWNGLK